MSDPARILDIRIHLIRAPLDEPILAPFGRVDVRHNLLVTAHLGDGVVGVGEVWANFPPWGCEERVTILRNVVRPALRGETLDDPVRLYDELLARMRPLANQMGAPGPFHQTLAGTDIALWDALARRRGEPLCDTIRGVAGANRAEVYATNLPIQRPDMIELMAEKGHTRFKVKLPQDSDVARRGLADARAAAGERMLMTDASQGYDPERLVSLLPALRAARLSWLEEPFPVDDLQAYRTWANHEARPPLAMGENSYGLDGFDRLMAEIGPEIVQPDITKTGGISRGATIARRVAGPGRMVCLHMYGGPVGLYASAHLAAACPEVSWVEMDSKPNPLFERLLPEPPRVARGRLELGSGAGLGFTLDPALLEAIDVTEG